MASLTLSAGGIRVKGSSKVEASVQPAAIRPNMNERLLLIGCMVIFSFGNLVGWLAPQVVFGVIDRYGVSVAQAGLPTMMEGMMVGLLTPLLSARAPNVTYRNLAIFGLALFIAANAMTAWAPNYPSLLATRLLSGAADAILAFVAVSLIAIKSPAPDRAYSLLTVAMLVLSAAIISGPSLLSLNVHGLAYLSLSAIVALFFAPLIVFLPREMRAGKSRSETYAWRPAGISSRGKLRFAILLAFMIPSYFQSFMLFTFSPAIGAGLGLSEASINSTLGAATLACTLGPVAAAAAANRFGRWWPLLIVGLLMLGANLVFTTTSNPDLFVPCLVINLVAGYFSLPLLLAWSADIDPAGRFSSVMMGTLTMVAAGSPAVAGEFVDRAGMGVLWSIVVASGVMFTAMLVLIRLVPANHDTSTGRWMRDADSTTDI